jgi:hypothetical protein
MERLLHLAIIVALWHVLPACSADRSKTNAKSQEPAWHWEWGSARSGGSSEQFTQDRYACMQEYRQTFPVQRDPVTDVQMLTFHSEICLQGKGWKKVPDRPPQPTQIRSLDESKSLIYWTPTGWVTAPPGTKKIDWFWQGDIKDEDAAMKRFVPDKEACMRHVGIVDPQQASTAQGEAFMACMWDKKWASKPVL